jgi:adenylate kinase family enzyme
MGFLKIHAANQIFLGADAVKLYITGSVGSGKTTLARKISKITGIPCRHLDEVVHEEDPIDSWGNRKRPVEVRDAIFAEILAEESWIMEDAGRECFLEGIRQADQVIFLDFPPLVRRKRILLRYMKQKLGLERCIYRPHFAVLKAMFRWADNYDSGKDNLKARIAPFRDKTVVLRSRRDVERCLKSLKREDAGELE